MHLSLCGQLECSYLCERYHKHGHSKTYDDVDNRVYPSSKLVFKNAFKVGVVQGIPHYRSDRCVHYELIVEGGVEDRVAVYVGVVGNGFCNTRGDLIKGEAVDKVTEDKEEHWKSCPMDNGTEYANDNQCNIQTCGKSKLQRKGRIAKVKSHEI